jgi:hypothetical protein
VRAAFAQDVLSEEARYVAHVEQREDRRRHIDLRSDRAMRAGNDAPMANRPGKTRSNTPTAELRGIGASGFKNLA